MSESWLKLLITNLMVSRLALRTFTTATNKGHRNPIPYLPFADIFTYCLNHPCQFMTVHMW